MNFVQKNALKVSDWLYKLDVDMEDQAEKYLLTTEYIEANFKNAGFPINIDLRKLVYYTAEKVIPAPKRVGILDSKGGSKGKYKAKSLEILWYLAELKERGIKTKEASTYVYNYFNSESLPPVPVDDTPLPERVIYTLKLNNITILSYFSFEVFTLPYRADSEVTEIPAIKLVGRNYANDGSPYIKILIPTRSLKDKETEFLEQLRSQDEYRKAEGVNIWKDLNGRFIQKNYSKLLILKNYPTVSALHKDDSYKDLLDYSLDFDCI